MTVSIVTAIRSTTAVNTTGIATDSGINSIAIAAATTNSASLIVLMLLQQLMGLC